MEPAPELAHDLLFPLSAFSTAELSGAGTRELSPTEIPEPYRNLLVHDRDMTSTLEGFHGEAMALRQLVRELRGPVLYRRVVLVGAESGKAAEFGAIAIWVDRFAAGARAEILAGRRPLGSILARHGVDYLSRPRAFFQLRPNAEIGALLGLDGDLSPRPPLYGRQNDLVTPGGEALAEVVEILPPIAGAAAG